MFKKFCTMNSVEKINWISLVFAGVFAVAMILIISFVSMNFNADMDINQVKITDLTNQLNTMQTKFAEKKDAEIVLNSAAEAGKSIANIQTAAVSDGLTSEQAELLKSYFGNDTDGFIWYSNSLYEDFVWEFNTTYSFTMSEVPVLWTMYADITDGANVSRKLIAYVTGMYSVEDNTFGGMSVNITSAGLTAQTTDAKGNVVIDSGIHTEPSDVWLDEDGVELSFEDGVWFEPDGVPRYIYDEANDTLLNYTEEDYFKLYQKTLDIPSTDIEDSSSSIDDMNGGDVE